MGINIFAATASTVDKTAPLELDFKSAQSSNSATVSLKTFTSYSFDRSLLTPASAFRFTAPGVGIAERLAIRSGDLVSIFASNKAGVKYPIATGIIDETDTHGVNSMVEYVLSGRDLLGQLVDNAAVDANNVIINVKNANLSIMLSTLIKNTRIPPAFIPQQLPNGVFLFQTNPGETKINALQRYLEFANCLVWSLPDGRLVLGKPNFTQSSSGKLTSNSSDPTSNNMVDWRVRRNLNQAIRQIVTQLQNLDQVYAGTFTKNNNDPDMLTVVRSGVGRSVYEHFSYGGDDLVNTLVGVGNQKANPRQVGDEYSLRKIATDNMKIIDVEAVVRSHINENGQPYNIDQVYDVFIDDENVSEPMYVYNVSYELTIDHGMMTRMRLCRLGAICAYTDAIGRQVAG